MICVTAGVYVRILEYLEHQSTVWWEGWYCDIRKNKNTDSNKIIINSNSNVLYAITLHIIILNSLLQSLVLYATLDMAGDFFEVRIINGLRRET
jgi:hypothetical protein